MPRKETLHRKLSKAAHRAADRKMRQGRTAVRAAGRIAVRKA